MPFDFEVEPGLTFGAWLYRELGRNCCLETDGWAGACVRRVTERLQGDRNPEGRLETVVIWIPEPTAFTGPGTYIYFSRSLLQRCPDDETAAFVVAHELAHHDLGHLEAFPRWMAGPAARLPGGWIGPVLYQTLERRLYGPEQECDADLRALELCIAAGYEPERCLNALAVTEQLALDFGDTDIVFGPDLEPLRNANGSPSWLDQARFWARVWAWQRARGYLPLRDRQAMLYKHLERLKDGSSAGTGRPAIAA